MQRPCLLAPEKHAAVASLRHPLHTPPLKISDPAARAITDFQRDPPLIAAEDVALEQALDEMFQLGVRALLVVRERAVIGLITAEHAEYAESALRVADVMTPAADVPAVDWQTIADARVCDLVEIFEGSGARHLMVLENEDAGHSSVRGLIHRGRLERQLGNRWAMGSATAD